MGLTFDGPNKRITLTGGTTSLGVRDLWSRWVDWWLTGDNSKYLPAFTNVGGDTIDSGAGTYIPIYAFLLNGWTIKPQEADHTLAVGDGILLVSGGGDPFVDTTGAYTVRIRYSQPVQAITVSTGGVGADAIWDALIESGYTAKEILRLIAGVVQGNALGLESGVPAFKSIDGSKTRVAGTYVAGTRTITSRDAT